MTDKSTVAISLTAILLRWRQNFALCANPQNTVFILNYTEVSSWRIEGNDYPRVLIGVGAAVIVKPPTIMRILGGTLSMLSLVS